jgi:hypothetical protein
MKLIIFLMSASIFGAAAAEPPTVKIPQWKEFKNLEFTKVEGDYVKFFHSNGISKVLLAVLPLDIQKKLVDLPVEDLEAKEAKQKKERLKLDLTKYRNDFGGVLYGKVLQVLDDGLLIQPLVFKRFKTEYKKKINYLEYYQMGSANFGRSSSYDSKTIETWDLVQKQETFSDVIFLYCDVSGMYDDKKIELTAYPAGNMTYTTKGGDQKTVLTLTTDLERSFKFLMKGMEDQELDSKKSDSVEDSVAPEGNQ